APGAAAAEMVEAVILNSHRVLPVCVMLEGEYGQHNVALGVPVKLGYNGVEEIIDLKLTDEEMALMETSANHVKAVMKVLDDLKLF
ncbi:MAG TPA: malate dehydrogenase, partial [Flavobacteriales bacterium]|nr:malate dehydrogenase [Flavobacteriales bacterium]